MWKLAFSAEAPKYTKGAGPSCYSRFYKSVSIPHRYQPAGATTAKASLRQGWVNKKIDVYTYFYYPFKLFLFDELKSFLSTR